MFSQKAFHPRYYRNLGSVSPSVINGRSWSSLVIRVTIVFSFLRQPSSRVTTCRPIKASCMHDLFIGTHAWNPTPLFPLTCTLGCVVYVRMGESYAYSTHVRWCVCLVAHLFWTTRRRSCAAALHRVLGWRTVLEKRVCTRAAVNFSSYPARAAVHTGPAAVESPCPCSASPISCQTSQGSMPCPCMQAAS